MKNVVSIGVKLVVDGRIMPIGIINRKVLKSEPYNGGRFVTVSVGGKEYKLFQSQYQIEEVTVNKEQLKSIPELKSPKILEIKPFKRTVRFIDGKGDSIRLEIRYGEITRNPYFSITGESAGGLGQIDFTPKNEAQQKLLDLWNKYHTRENVPSDIEKVVDGIIKDIELREDNEQDDFGLSGWMLTALQELAEYENDVFTSAEEENAFGIDFLRVTGAGEYLVFENDEDAEKYAVEMVKEDLEEDPSMFNQDWLQQYIEIDDAYTIALEEAEDYLRDMSDNDLIDQYADSDDKDEYEEYDFGDKYDDEDREERMEEIVERVREQAIETYADDKEQEIKDDPVGWLTENGYDLSNLPNFASLDIDGASQDAVDTDGVAHFLNRYDGDVIELPSGAEAYRQ